MGRLKVQTLVLVLLFAAPLMCELDALPLK
jgi:hypothetical protein